MGHAVVPVVTEIESGNSEVVRDGESGFVVRVGDVRGAAERLAFLAGDRAALRRMRRAAWERSLQFSVQRMVENYVACFEHVTSAGFARGHRLAAPRPFPVMQSCRSRYPFWIRKIKARVLTSNSR
jgi:hypothetical protein